MPRWSALLLLFGALAGCGVAPDSGRSVDPTPDDRSYSAPKGVWPAKKLAERLYYI